MIETNKFKLSEKEYYKILFLNTFIYRQWFVLVLIIVMILGIFSERYWLCLLLPLYLIIFPLYLFSFVKKSNNPAIRHDMIISFDDKFIFGKLSDGSENKLNMENIIKIRNRNKYYLLYISKHQFIYIPKIAFKSNSDRETFEKIVISQCT